MENTMAKKLNIFAVFCLILGFMLMLPHGAFTASLPKSTQKILKKLKVEPSILTGLDKELKVPDEWIDGAKKRGQGNGPWHSSQHQGNEPHRCAV